MIRVQLMVGGHWKIIEGPNPFFANNSWQDRDRDTHMVQNDSTRQFGSEDMHIDLLRSWPNLHLAWPEVEFWNWPSRPKDTFSKPSRRAEHDGAVFIFVSLTIIKKVISEKLSLWKIYFFLWCPREPKLLTLGQIWAKDVTGAWRELPYAFF